MPDAPVPISPDTPAEVVTSIPAPRNNAEVFTPPTGTPPNLPEERPPADAPVAPGGPSWWLWPLGFLVVFIMDAALVLVLLAQDRGLLVAVGVPGTLTAGALGVLRALAGHMGRRG
jgi:hypothetical protein